MADAALRALPIDEARETVTKDRSSQYGAPEDNFEAIAALWALYDRFVPVGKYDPKHDMSMKMVLMKVGRIMTGTPGVKDNYVDLIGYGAIAYEQVTVSLASVPVEVPAYRDGPEFVPHPYLQRTVPDGHCSRCGYRGEDSLHQRIRPTYEQLLATKADSELRLAQGVPSSPPFDPLPASTSRLSSESYADARGLREADSREDPPSPTSA